MNQGRRIVITGMGQISPIGLNIHDAWKNCLLGKSGITSFKVDVDNIPVSIAGRILQDGREYIPGEKYVEKKLLILLSYMDWLLLKMLLRMPELQKIMILTQQKLELILVQE